MITIWNPGINLLLSCEDLKSPALSITFTFWIETNHIEEICPDINLIKFSTSWHFVLKCWFSYLPHTITHYYDFITGGMASQITSLAVVYRLLRHRSKKTPQLRVTGLCEGNSPMAGEFPAQRSSNAENVSIWWRHHARLISETEIFCWYPGASNFKNLWSYEAAMYISFTIAVWFLGGNMKQKHSCFPWSISTIL